MNAAQLKRTACTLLAAAGTLLAMSAQAADTAASGAMLNRAEAKDLKNQSDAKYDANKKVSEANESLNKADCKSALDGSAKRACEASAKQHAKADKADAKTEHKMEEQAIDHAKK